MPDHHFSVDQLADAARGDDALFLPIVHHCRQCPECRRLLEVILLLTLAARLDREEAKRR